MWASDNHWNSGFGPVQAARDCVLAMVPRRAGEPRMLHAGSEHELGGRDPLLQMKCSRAESLVCDRLVARYSGGRACSQGMHKQTGTPETAAR